MNLITTFKKGFTLVEMLLYVSISSIFLLSLTVYFSTLFEANVKNQTINEVNQQGIQITEFITQIIRNAKAVTSPTPSASSSQITLTVSNASSSPTIFDIATGTLRMKEGIGQYLSLSNTKVTVSSLSFLNTSASSTDGGSIEVSFVLSYVSTSTQNPYVYTKTFKGSASFH